MASKRRDNPSLIGRFREIFDAAWGRGREGAVRSMIEWDGLPDGSKARRPEERRLEALLPENCPYCLLEVTAYDTGHHKPKIRDEIIPPRVARIHNECAGGGYVVRSWTELGVAVEFDRKSALGRSR